MVEADKTTECLRLIAKNLYYGPAPAVIVGMDAQIVDYNLAFELIGGAHVSSCRGRPWTELAHRLSHCVVQGTLLPDPSQVGGTHCTVLTDEFGCVHLVGREAMCHDICTGGIKGRIITWEVIPSEGVLRDRLRETLKHQLTWEAYATSYDRILSIMPYYREVVERHRAALSGTPSGPIIDLGAGTGNLAQTLIADGRPLTVVDTSRAMLDKLRSKPDLASAIGKRLSVIETSAESLPMIPDASFVGVSLLLSLFDMQAPASALETAIRILKPGGTLVVTELKQNFQLTPILEECNRQVRARGEFPALADDLERVVRSNLALSPGSLSSLRAEYVFELLASRAFEDVTFVDSHFGQCATITGRKPADGEAPNSG